VHFLCVETPQGADGAAGGPGSPRDGRCAPWGGPRTSGTQPPAEHAVDVRGRAAVQPGQQPRDR
jgi:hypothetical protein